MEAALVDVTNQGELQAWLHERSREVSVGLAARAALRVVPLIWADCGRGGFETRIVLPVFRATAVASAAASYPAQAARLPATEAAFIAAAASVHAAAAGHAAAAVDDAYAYDQPAYAGATDADAAAHERAAAAGVAYAAADATVASTSAGDAFRDAMAADIAMIEAGRSADWLARQKLWPKWVPDVDHLWRDLRDRLLARNGENWEVWTDWYDDRLAGRSSDEGLEIARVMIGDATWNEGPVVLNAMIKALIKDFNERTKVGEDETHQDADVTSSPSVPSMRPAAIEPEVRDGKIILPRTPAAADADAESIAAALGILKVELKELADDIEHEPNLDKRFAKRLRDCAERCEVEAPSQYQIFRLGHDYSVVANYASTIDREWPTHMAASYHALRLHFERCVKKFSKWVAFLDQAKETLSTVEQIAEVAKIGADVAAAARDEDGSQFIDPAIPDSLQDLRAPLESIGDDRRLRNTPSSVEDELAADVLDSVNNILKRAVELSLATAKTLSRPMSTSGRLVKEAANEFVTKADKSVIKEAGRLGEETGPAVTRWVKRLLFAGSSCFSVLHLIHSYPATFGWLESVLHWLK